MPTKQKCNICGESKVLTDFPQANKVHGVMRYKKTCISCVEIEGTKVFKKSKIVVDDAQSIPLIDTSNLEDYREGYKMCNKCGVEKPISEFFKDRVSNGRQTYRGECKICSQAAAKSRISRYRSKKRILANGLSKEEWQTAIDHFDGHCAYCLTGAAECQEHLLPVDKGGSFTADNIVPACLRCNSSKGNRHLKYWWKQQPFFTQSALDKVEAWVVSRKELEDE